MATKQQIEEVTKEANAVVAEYTSSGRTHAEVLAAGLEHVPDVEELKAAIVELAVIARSHAPMAQEARIVELLAMAQ